MEEILLPGELASEVVDWCESDEIDEIGGKLDSGLLAIGEFTDC